MLVFIASPGDVREERAAVRRVVDEIDIRVARALGWTVRAVGWEHQRPGLGRPQDLINPAVAECDVLVGILGTGWGTDTGLYSSGFEEEFELIAARHAQGELVEGMLYLRRLSDGTAADPANVAFRERVRTRAMYKEYVGLADFEHKLLGDLVEMLMVLERRAREEEVASADAALTMRPSEDTGSGVVDATVELPSGSHHGEVQAADALRLVAEGDNDDLTVIRAHLATAARLSAQLTSGLLDVHDLNRAYIHRASLKLSEEERALVLRSAVAIGSAGPCWALLPGDDDEALRSVAAVALRDSQPKVRRGAFQELGPTGIRELAARIETSDFSSVDFFEMLLADDDAGVGARPSTRCL
jgi:hypothetical protein